MEAALHNTKVIGSFIRKVFEQQHKKIKVFGVGIDSYMVMQKPNIKFLHVPVIVRICADEVIEHGTSLEGIFRVPGAHNAINNICNSFENGEIPQFDTVGPEEVSGAYKKYLRDLPHPLLTDDSLDHKLASRFAEVITLGTVREKCKRLRKLFRKLSLYRRALAKEMFYCLYLVSLDSAKNKMDSHNLATIFGGMVNIVSDTMTTPAKSEFCAFLIDYFPYIWKGIDELKPITELNLSEEKKNKKISIQVFLDDGTFVSIPANPDITCSVLSEMIRTKLKNREIDASNNVMVEIYNREIRLVGMEEYVYPIVTSSSILFFSSKLDLSHLGPYIPINPNLEDPNLVSEESMTEGETVPSLDNSAQDESSEVSKSEKEEPEPISTVITTEPVNQDNSKRKISYPSLLNEKKVMITSPKKEDKAQKRKSKRKTGKLWSFGVEEDDDTLEYIMSQIQTQEKTYLENLRLIINEYKNPLQADGFVNTDDITCLFSNIDKILSHHESLQQLCNENNAAQYFTQLISQMKLYSGYVSNHCLAKTTLFRLKQENPKFLEYLSKSPKSIDQLNQLLDTPINRILDYEQSVKKIIHVTPAEDSNTTIFGKVDLSVQELAPLIRKQQQLSPQLLELSKRVEKIPEYFDFTIPQRQFIQHDEASVRFFEDKKPRIGCHVVVLTDVLFIYSSQKKFGRRTLDTCIAVLILNKSYCSDDLVVDAVTSQNAIKFSSGDGKVVFFSEISDHKKWINTVRSAIKNASQPYALKESWTPCSSALTLAPNGPKKFKRKSFAGATKHSMVKRSVRSDDKLGIENNNTTKSRLIIGQKSPSCSPRNPDSIDSLPSPDSTARKPRGDNPYKKGFSKFIGKDEDVISSGDDNSMLEGETNSQRANFTMSLQDIYIKVSDDTQETRSKSDRSSNSTGSTPRIIIQPVGVGLSYVSPEQPVNNQDNK